MRELTADKLKVRVYSSREELGNDAAMMAATTIRELLTQQPFVNIIFAAAASQNEFLKALSTEEIDWTRVNAFHMDEYIGLPEGSAKSFSTFLKKGLFSKVPLNEIHYLRGYVADIEGECQRYTELLEQYPVDIACMGIGENSHLAFNDPHVADFNDTSMVKVVDLDEACKQQQVGEGCFDNVEQIPMHALTLTIPALLNAPFIFCMVPGAPKAVAVAHTLEDEICERYPSTILRKHPNAILFLDTESAGRLSRETVRPELINYK